MGVIPKKLFQVQLGETEEEIYTAPSETITQITEIWVTNPTETAIDLTLKAHGDSEDNTILYEDEIENNKRFEGAKIVLAAGEKVYAEGEDLVLTGYGIEESVD